MSELLCLSEYQPTPQNMIPVEWIENVDLYQGNYTIAYKDATGTHRSIKKLKTRYITLQLEQFKVTVNEIY